MLDALISTTLETMKTADCFVLGIVGASMALYYGMPIPREIQCFELASADKQASNHPYLAQGLLFATGAIFSLVVTSVGEWKSEALKESSKKKKVNFLFKMFFYNQINALKKISIL